MAEKRKFSLLGRDAQSHQVADHLAGRQMVELAAGLYDLTVGLEVGGRSHDVDDDQEQQRRKTLLYTDDDNNANNCAAWWSRQKLAIKVVTRMPVGKRAWGSKVGSVPCKQQVAQGHKEYLGRVYGSIRIKC